MAAGLNWTRRDKMRAKAILKALADKAGGWQGIADALGMDVDSSRATVHSWHRRSRVSLQYAANVRDLARKHEISCELSELSPQAKHLENVK